MAGKDLAIFLALANTGFFIFIVLCEYWRHK